MNDEDISKIIDVRFHGRGGQGVVTGARLLAEAALLEEKHVHSFPSFGPERAGAPIAGFCRLSKERFTIKTEIYEPDYVIVQDPTLLKQINVLAGIKHNGVVVVNYDGNKDKLLEELRPPSNITVGMVNATKIANEIIGKPVVNTGMVGALIKITKVVDLDSVIESIKNLFPGEIGELNAKAIEQAYNETIIVQKADLSKTIATDYGKTFQKSTSPDEFTEWITEKWGAEKLPLGTVVPVPGSSLAFKTGDWAAYQPELIKEKCVSCLTCFFVCPDSAITMDYSENPKGYPVIHTEYCKGCGICAYECDEKALSFPGITDESLGKTDVSEEECVTTEGGK